MMLKKALDFANNYFMGRDMRVWHNYEVYSNNWFQLDAYKRYHEERALKREKWKDLALNIILPNILSFGSVAAYLATGEEACFGFLPIGEGIRNVRRHYFEKKKETIKKIRKSILERDLMEEERIGERRL